MDHSISAGDRCQLYFLTKRERHNKAHGYLCGCHWDAGQSDSEWVYCMYKKKQQHRNNLRKTKMG